MTVSAIFLDDEDKHIRCLYDEKLHSFEGISFTQVIHPGDLEYEYVELPYDPEQQGDRDDDI
jgi:hypothetical protein